VGADRLGDPTARQLGRITLNPMAHIDWIGTVLFPLIAMVSGFPLFEWAKPVPVDWRNLKSPRRDFAVIAAAGPISNLLLAALVASVLLVLGGPNAISSDILRYAIVGAIVMNCLLAVFNLVPVPPLDGGNVLMGLLPPSGAALIERVRPYGFLLLYVLMLSGVLSAMLRPVQRFVLGWLL